MVDRRVRIAAITVAFLYFVVAAFFAGKVIKQELEYKKGNDTYDEIEQIAYVEIPAPSASPVPVLHSDVQQTPTSNSEPEQVQEELPYDPDDVNFPSISFDALSNVSGDICAWLYLPYSVINYPVTQTTDNNYYLTHLADGTYNLNGCLFIDYRNEPGFQGRNTLIYGHNMASGRMFASLINYADQEYFNDHPCMYVVTKDARYKLVLFSGYTTEAWSSAYNFSFNSHDEYSSWLSKVLAQSDFQIREPLTITDADHVVTLSTCAYSFEDARYVVHGLLVDRTPR